MVCHLRNLTYYLNACYAIIYAEGMGGRIQAIGKTNAFFNGAMIHTCYNFMKVLSTELSWHV